SFSKDGLNVQLVSNTDTNRAKVIRNAAKTYRMDYLDRHIIRYLTQNVGKYMAGKADFFQFDTMRLRRLFQVELKERDILQPFVFKLNEEDNTLNRNSIPDTLARKYTVITKAFPTYKGEEGQAYIRAMFTYPSGYLFSKTKYLLLGSVVLIIIVSMSS